MSSRAIAYKPVAYKKTKCNEDFLKTRHKKNKII